MARRRLSATGGLTEAAFQEQVIGLLRVYGFELIYHAPENRPAGARNRPQALAAQEGKGFPDVVAIHVPRRRLLVAELKTDTGSVAPRQRIWLAGFEAIAAAVREAVFLAADSPASAEADQAPSVEAYLWRPRDWHELHAVIRGGQEHRRDLDPLEFG